MAAGAHLLCSEKKEADDSADGELINVATVACFTLGLGRDKHRLLNDEG